MSIRQNITDVQASIEAAVAEIAKTRAEIAKRIVLKREGEVKIEKLLATLPKLKAERLRLMQHQLTHAK